MCKAFEEKMKQGFDRGLEVGMQQGADSERIRIIRLLMNNPTMGQKLSAQQAMKMLNIPAEDQARYLQMI